MNDFDVLARGPFALHELRVHDVPPRRPGDADWEAGIDRLWQEGLARAQSEGRLLFDGPVMRLVQHRVVESEPSRLELDVCEGRYRRFYGSNLRQGARLGEVPWDHFENPVGTSALMITADARVVLGRRSSRVAHYGGRVHCFGGIVEPQDRDASGGYDIARGLRREFREELGLAEDGPIDLDVLGLVRDHEIVQPELLFRARIPEDLASLRRSWRASGCEEHDELVDLPWEAEALRATAAQPETVGVARAALLLLADLPHPPEA